MSKSTLWVHIGMPKTGSSSLQWTLSNNRDKLARYGYLYPNLGIEQHLPLVRALSKEIGSPAVFPPEGSNETLFQMVSRIKQEKQDIGANNVILSSEFFFDYPGLTPNRGDFPIQQAVPYLRSVCEKLRECFEEFDIKVVVWLRRQDDWLMSMYNNVIKSLNLHDDFDIFLRRQVAPWYGSILNQWGDIYGTENVKLFIYDRKNARDVIDVFFEHIGFPAVEQLDRSFLRVRYTNIGLPRDLMYIKRHFNKILDGQSAPLIRRELEEFFFRAAQEKSFWTNNHAIISPKERLNIIDMFAKENEIVLTRFKPHNGHTLFDNYLPKDSEWIPYTSPDLNILMDIYSRILINIMRKVNQQRQTIDSLKHQKDEN